MVVLKRRQPHLSGSYKSDKKRCARQGRNIDDLDYLEELISSGEEIPASTHKPHKLKRNNQYLECHVTSTADDWVLVYKFISTTVTFIATGSHSHVMSSLRRYLI